MRAKTILCLLLIVVVTAPLFAAQKLDSSCVVTVLNRVARVAEDGGWTINDVPSALGQVRARATCQRDGVTTIGQSGFFTVTENGVVNGVGIEFEILKAVPSQLSLTAPSASLSQIGQTVQLTATARYSDDTTADVTNGVKGTTFRSSNPAIATVSPNGLVSATGKGTVILSATNDGALGLLRLQIAAVTDNDNDGLPDDWELANGLNPNNAADATADGDHDGVNNLDEYRYLINPRSADSDGDGVRDGTEIKTGSNPADALSYDLAKALTRIDASPSSVRMEVDPFGGEVSRQLAIIGRMIDGFTIDLTSRTRGTNYSSSDLLVASFGTTDGRIYAGKLGTATVTAKNSGFTASCFVTVAPYTPAAVGSLAGVNGTRLQIIGRYAYVNINETSIAVIDLSKPAAPKLVSSTPMPAYLNDFTIVEGILYGVLGNRTIAAYSLADPVAPSLISTTTVHGYPVHVTVQNGHAYVTTNFDWVDSDGVVAVDVRDPAAMYETDKITVRGTPRDIVAWHDSVVLTTGYEDTVLYVLDISTPDHPVVMSATHLDGVSERLAVRNGLVYVGGQAGTDSNGKPSALQVVDITNPVQPHRLGGATDGFGCSDMAIVGDLLFTADDTSFNRVAMVNIANPAAPYFQQGISLSNYGFGSSGLIAADAQYAYKVAGNQLIVARYRMINDGAGIAPVVQITAPEPGTEVVAGQYVDVVLNATDDFVPALATISVNGKAVAAIQPPFTTSVRVPSGDHMTIGATVADTAGNVGTAEAVTLPVIADPLTTVTGIVVDQNGAPVSDATVRAGTLETVTDLSGAYTISGVPSGAAAMLVFARKPDGCGYFSGAAAAQSETGGVTTMPDLVLTRIVRESEFSLGENIDGALDGNTMAFLTGSEWDDSQHMIRVATISEAGTVTMHTPLPTDRTLRSVAVSGNTAIATGGGVQLFDISNPDAPRLLTKIGDPAGGSAGRIVATGNRAYILNQTGLEVVDISNTSSPRLLSFTNARGSEEGIDLHYLHVSGNYVAVSGWAYWPDYGEFVTLIDVSNPEVPIIRGQMVVATASDIFADGTTVYSVSHGETGALIQVLDFSTLNAPKILTELQTSWPIAFSSAGALQNGYLYLANVVGYPYNQPQKVDVIDVRTPAVPHEIGSFAVYRHGSTTSREFLSSCGTGVLMTDNGGNALFTLHPSRVGGAQ